MTAKTLLALLRALPMLQGPWFETKPMGLPVPAMVDIDLDRLAAEPPAVDLIQLDLDEDDEAGWITHPGVRTWRS